MNLRVVILDDNLDSTWSPLFEALKPFLGNTSFADVETKLKRKQPLALEGFPDSPVEVMVSFNRDRNVDSVVAEIQSGAFKGDIDLVLVDDQWGGGTDKFAGQDLLLDPAFKNLKGRHGDAPLLVLWTQHWLTEDARTNRYTDLLRREPFWGKNRLLALDKKDIAGLRLLFQRIVAERSLAQRCLEMEKVASSPFQLLGKTTHLVGLDQQRYALARSVEDLVRWKQGFYEGLRERMGAVPRQLKPLFTSGFLLEGEPGSGKTTLCDAIEETVADVAMHPSPMQPSNEKQRVWHGELAALLSKVADKCAKKPGRKVVVLRCENWEWPRTGRVVDKAMGAEWRNFLGALEECLVATKVFNDTGTAEGDFIGKLRSAGEAKLLWLFVRNQDEDVGEMFAPLRDKLLPVQVQFPRDVDARKRILNIHAEAEGFVFQKGALDLAAESLLDYNGRELVGAAQVGRGFLMYAMQAARDRVIAELEEGADRDSFEFLITEDIVRRWLEEPEHKAIVRQLPDSNFARENTPITSTPLTDEKRGDRVWRQVAQGRTVFAQDPNDNRVFRLMNCLGEVEVVPRSGEETLYAAWIKHLVRDDAAHVGVAVVARAVLESNVLAPRAGWRVLKTIGTYHDDQHETMRVTVSRGFDKVRGITREAVFRGEFDELIRSVFSDVPRSGCLYTILRDAIEEADRSRSPLPPLGRLFELT